MSKKKHNLEAIGNKLADRGFLQRARTELKLAYWLLRQRDVPLLTKLVPVLTLAYVLAPIDIIPDFLPVLGQIDDLALFMLGVRIFLHLAPPPVIGRYEKEQAEPLPEPAPVDPLTEVLDAAAPPRI